jgi:cytochrome b involved in lipid metabolism
MGNKPSGEAKPAAKAEEDLSLPDVSQLPELTREQVKSDSRKLLIIDEVVYDVTEFRDKHPGGGELLDEYIGGDATKDFKDAGHSRTALFTLKKLAVARVV